MVVATSLARTVIVKPRGRPVFFASSESELAPGRRGWLQVARGTPTLDGQALAQGDGAAIESDAFEAGNSLTGHAVCLSSLVVVGN